jgi:hypothetical protein
VPRLEFSDSAREVMQSLQRDPSQFARLKSVRAALAKMECNLRHPGLRSHEFKGSQCPHGDKLFEAYAQNNTPGAFRIFWCYMPKPAVDAILIVAITSHP